MTAIDWTNPAEVAEEARRRNRARAEGRPLTEPEPVIVPASSRAWPRTAIELPRPRSLCRELIEQNLILKMFRAAECRPESTSQTRKSKVALGLPDLFVFGPPYLARAWFFEVKSGEDWRFSNPQMEWAERCLATNTLYAAGDRYAAAAFLRWLNVRIPEEYDYR